MSGWVLTRHDSKLAHYALICTEIIRTMSSVVPVIDFGACSGPNSDDISQSDLEKRGRSLVDALSNIGCAYITNSGLEVDSAFKITEKFFQCRKEEKDKFAFDRKRYFGYIAMETETVVPNKPADYKEAFSIYGAQAFQHLNNWPDDLAPGFSDTIKKFMNDCKKFGYLVLESLSLGLGLKEESHLKNCHKFIHQDGNTTMFKSTYYPAVTEELKPGQLRHAEHTDFGSITFIFQDDVGGLQFEYEEEFIDIAPLDGGIVLLAGDVFNMKSCGRIKAITHRVVAPEKMGNRVRQSLQYFMVPDDESIAAEALLYKDEAKNERNAGIVRPSLTTRQHIENRANAFYVYYQ